MQLHRKFPKLKCELRDFVGTLMVANLYQTTQVVSSISIIAIVMFMLATDNTEIT